MRSDGRERPEEEKRGPGPSGTGAHRRPKVSVCIPAYNNEAQVRQLLDCTGVAQNINFLKPRS